MSVINTQTNPMIHVGTSASPQSTDLNGMLGAATRAAQGSAAVQAPIAQPMTAPTARLMKGEEAVESQRVYDATYAETKPKSDSKEFLLNRAKEAQQALRETKEWLDRRVLGSPSAKSKDALAKVDAALEAATKAVTAANAVAQDGDPPTVAAANKAYEEMEAAQKLALSAVSDLSFINNLFNKFANATVEGDNGKRVSFDEHLNERISALGENDSSDPQNLAKYQKAIMMFTVHTNAMSSMIKSIADLDKGVVRDFN